MVQADSRMRQPAAEAVRRTRTVPRAGLVLARASHILLGLALQTLSCTGLRLAHATLEAQLRKPPIQAAHGRGLAELSVGSIRRLIELHSELGNLLQQPSLFDLDIAHFRSRGLRGRFHAPP